MIYALSKILTALLLPPGILVLLLAAAAWRLRPWRPLLGSAALLLYLLSIDPVANALLGYFENPWRHTPLPSRADAVVSLGAHTVADSPLPNSGEGLKRHLYALALGKRYDAPVIVTGRGNVGFSDYDALRKSLATLGPLLTSPPPLRENPTPGFSLVPETASADTYENARYTMAKIGDTNATLVLVTSAYHMHRTVRLFRLAGAKDPHPAAAVFYAHPDRPLRWRDFLPTVWSLLNSYRALHEALGLVKVWTREKIQTGTERTR